MVNEYGHLFDLLPGEFSRLADETVSEYPRTWRLVGPLGYRDRCGRLWIMPDGMYTDFTSSPRWGWWYHPPRMGQGDRAAAFHDFQRRCYALIGVTIRESDWAFREALRDDGIGKRKALTKTLSVLLQGTFDRSAGMGEHSDSRFNGPLRSGEPLASWVARHYKPDGNGFMETRNGT